MNEKIAKILSEYVIHCDTEKKAMELLRILHFYGYVWRSGGSLLTSLFWDTYGIHTYYTAVGHYVIYGKITGYIPGRIIMSFNEFKERLNMEKEVKIQVPEGYEIDEENSTFKCIKFKPIKKVETYDDVARELFYSKETYYICSQGEIKHLMENKGPSNESNNCVTEKQAEKLLAINKLMNVASYLNKDWKPDWKDQAQNKFYIFIRNDEIRIDYVAVSNDGAVVFPDRETAQRATKILGEETIRLALGDY